MTEEAALYALSAGRHERVPRSGLELRLANDCAVLDAGDEWIVFSEEQQQTYRINAAAACIAHALRGNTPATVNGLERSLIDAGLDAKSAQQGVRAILAQWTQAGLVTTTAPEGPVAQRLTLSLCGQCFELSFENDALARLAAAVLPSSAHDGGSSAEAERWRIGWSDGLATLSRSGEPAVLAEQERIVPALKTALSEALISRSTAFSALHAACLVRHGKALLLLGPPGAGKSTLTARLENFGFAIEGDDLAFLGFDGLVTAAPFPLTVKSGAWPLVAAFRPDIVHAPTHNRIDGQQVRYVCPSRQATGGAHPLGWTVRLRREAGEAARLVPRPIPDALADLLDEAFSARGRTRLRDLRMVLDVLSRAQSFELVYSDLDEACALLQQTCARA